MKVSTKFLLTVAATALTLPLMAADCFASDGIAEGEGEGEGEGAEGEGEGEGEGEVDDRDCVLGGGFADADGDFDAEATATFDGPDAICPNAAAPNLIAISVDVTAGEFGDPVAIGNADVQLSIDGGAPTPCTNSPSVVEVDGFVIVFCPLCISGSEFPADLDVAVQVTDSTDAVSAAVCVDEEI